MKITRIAALSVILASTAVPALFAQGLQTKGSPAEVPPASFKAKQYVDSRGCVYIRAGIDGNVTWVPRVDRSRKQLCGFKPSNVAGASSAPQVKTSRPVELITIPQEAASAAVAPTVVAPAPQAVQPAKPRRTAATTSTGAAKAPVRTVKPQVIPAPAPKPKPVRKVAPAPKPAVPVAPGRCPGASALSQQYINQGAGVRCGPQAADPLSFLSPNTRVLPVHVYQARLAEKDIKIPAGYRPVWTDGRLNPHRAEMTLRRPQVNAVAQVPEGFVLVDRADDRLNLSRAQRTAAGDAQMAQIWSSRRGLYAPILPSPDKPIYKRSVLQAELEARSVGVSRQAQQPAAEPMVMRLSTRSVQPEVQPEVRRRQVKQAAPKVIAVPKQAAAVPQRYVRAGRFTGRDQALAAAQTLRARTGLPVRIGRLSGSTGHVVLAGPFGAQAEQALAMVRRAGHGSARLTK